MYAVCVELRIIPEHMSDFLPLMRENAAVSLRDEAGCLQFDVIEVEGESGLILLYELYVDAGAFQTHLATAHFKAFDAATTDMVHAKTVRTGPRLHP